MPRVFRKLFFQLVTASIFIKISFLWPSIACNIHVKSRSEAVFMQKIEFSLICDFLSSLPQEFSLQTNDLVSFYRKKLVKCQSCAKFELNCMKRGQLLLKIRNLDPTNPLDSKFSLLSTPEITLAPISLPNELEVFIGTLNISQHLLFHNFCGKQHTAFTQ